MASFHRFLPVPHARAGFQSSPIEFSASESPFASFVIRFRSSFDSSLDSLLSGDFAEPRDNPFDNAHVHRHA